MFAPLRVPNFRRLFVSASLSSMGDWLDLVALLALVSVVWDKGAFGLAAVSVAVGLPQLLAPLLGVWVDRWPVRRVLVLMDVLRAVATAGLFFAPGLAVLLPLVFLRACCGAGFVAAEQTAIRLSIPDELLVPANSLNQMMLQSVKIIGPAVGGLIVASSSIHAAFAVNAASYALSAVLLVGIRLADRPRSESDAQGYFAELREGARFVLTSAPLRTLGVVMAVLMAVIFLYDSMSPLAVEGLGLEPAWIGYLLAAVGVGGVLGAAMVSKYFSGERPFLLIGASVLAIGALIASIGLGIVESWRPGPAPWLAVVFLVGVASAGVLVPYAYVLQTSTPPDRMGRVVTLMGVIPGLCAVLSPSIAAWLVDHWGPGPVFLGAGSALLGTAVLLILAQPRLRSVAVPQTIPTVQPDLSA